MQHRESLQLSSILVVLKVKTLPGRCPGSELFFKSKKSGKKFANVFQEALPERFWTKFWTRRGAQNPPKSTQNQKKACSGAIIWRVSVSASIFHNFSSDFHLFLHQFPDVIFNQISTVFGVRFLSKFAFFWNFPEKREN